jgi:DNA polymerase III delta subunit
VAPIQLLNIISGVLIKIIKVKRLQAAGTESSEIFTQAGLNYFEKDFVGQAGRFAGLPVMLDALSKSLEYERDLKTSSGAEPEIILKSLIFKMLSGGGTKRA